MQNFFDTFAQWINSSLLGENALPVKRVSLCNVVVKIPEFPEYSGTFINDFLSITSVPFYIYISDLNNTQKHRYQLYVQNNFDLLEVQGEVTALYSEKDDRVRLKADVLNIVADGLSYCRKLLTDSQNFVENYYSSNYSNYVEHRIYNPKTYLYFNSKEDFEQMKNPTNHYHYIEVDVTDVLPQYQIMLVRDALDQHDGRIEIHNSV